VRLSSTRRFRHLAVALAVGGLAATASCSSDGSAPATSSSSAASSAAPTTDAGAGTYLALGDSVPFGFRGGATSEYSDADNFVGYPELVGEQLGLDVVNASCPGETTGSLLEVTAQSNGCENSLQPGGGYRTAFPLHVPYAAADQSQLDFAVQTLTETDDVELVTLQIGANDGFLCQQTTADRCTSRSEVENLAASVQANLDRILKTVREHYDGQVVVVTYYALDYSDQMGTATQVLDAGMAQIAQANGADVADGYEAFRSAATGAGGSSVDAGLVLPNDVHPTEQGQRLLADAVTAVAR
jgi:lysophospholipase L1-like esterase